MSRGAVERAAEDDRGLRAGLGREALLEQVLGLLGLDARDGEVVLEAPPAATAPPMTPTRARRTASVAARGRRPTRSAMRERREDMAGKIHRLSLKINCI